MTSRILTRLAVVVALFLLDPTNLVGQQLDSAASLQRLLERARSANQIVRFHSVAGVESAGRIAALTDSTVRIGRQTLRFFDQRSLEARFSHADPLWNGAAIGAVVSVLISYPLVTSFAASMSEQRLTRRERVSIAFGSALLGMLVGGSIDAARERQPEWRLVWRRDGP